MNIYDELNKIMGDLRDAINVAKNDAARNEKSAEEHLAVARTQRAQAEAYRDTLNRLEKIEFPQ